MTEMAEMDKLGFMFFSSVFLVVILGTIGSVLFKYGTDRLGSITFERLAGVTVNTEFLLYSVLMIFGVILVFYSGYSLREHSFAMYYLFSPVIFLSLLILFVSRFLIGIPLSMTGLGRLSVVVTVLSMVATVIASYLVFKETFSIKVFLGIVLGVIAIFLIGEEGVYG
mgnify:CR=1 FL=1